MQQKPGQSEGPARSVTRTVSSPLSFPPPQQDFLRSIPRKLLSCDLFEEWMDALEKQNEDNRVEALKQ